MKKQTILSTLITALIVSTLLIGTNAFAKDSPIQVLVSECLEFSLIPDETSAIEGIHYTKFPEETDTDCDSQGENCAYRDVLTSRYLYAKINTYHHYSRDGVLLAKTSSRSQTQISVEAYNWDNLMKNTRFEISRIIYDSPVKACDDSTYRD